MIVRPLAAVAPLAWLVALCATAAACFIIAKLPGVQLPVAVVAVAYVACLVRYPNSWLLLLPALLPVFDLAMWTGHFYLDEFDALVLLTIAVRLSVRPVARTSQAWPLGGLFAISALLAVHALATLRGLWPLSPVEAAEFHNYHSSLNALRVAKGVAWAWLLFGLLERDEPQRFERQCTVALHGLVAGLALTTVVFLWERGVFEGVWEWQGAYAFLARLLDFSTTYRATGPFSAMHTGGTATDGYLALVLPLALLPTFFARGDVWRAVGLAVFLGGAYCVVVTFSRALYAGVLVGLLTVGALALVHAVRRVDLSVGRAVLGLALVPCVGVLASLAHRFGGTGGVVVVAAVVLGAVCCRVVLGAFNRWLGVAGAVVITLIGVVALIDSVLDSRYHSLPRELGAGVGAGLAALSLVVGLLTPRPTLRAHTGAWLASVALCVLVAVAAVSVSSGYRIGERVATVGEDLGTRGDHWTKAVRMMPTGPVGIALGAGGGAFPRYFFRNNVGGELPLVSFALREHADGTALQLDRGDFNMLQRTAVRDGEPYTVEMRLRGSGSRPAVAVKVCNKHMIWAERWQPTCSRVLMRAGSGAAWTTATATLRVEGLATSGMLAHPETLMLTNAGREGPVEIDRISIRDRTGRDIVRNGDFESGLDRWIFVSDFEHLAWHIKSVFVHALFETGVVGLLVFVVGLMLGIGRSVWAALRGSRLGVVLAGVLVSFALTGVFGTIVDNPRIALIYYFVLFMALTVSPPDTPGVAVRRPIGARPTPASEAPRRRMSRRPR